VLHQHQEHMTVMLQFTVPATVKKRRKWFVASCPPLDVHSQGATEAQAKVNLVDALVSFFLSCWERGTLGDVLREAGFMPVHADPRSPKRRPSTDTVDVPLPFVIEATKSRQLEAH